MRGSGIPVHEHGHGLRNDIIRGLLRRSRGTFRPRLQAAVDVGGEVRGDGSAGEGEGDTTLDLAAAADEFGVSQAGRDRGERGFRAVGDGRILNSVMDEGPIIQLAWNAFRPVPSLSCVCCRGVEEGMEVVDPDLCRARGGGRGVER